MPLTNLMIFAGLLVFVIAWWNRGLRNRETILRVALIVVISTSLWGVLISRWQAGATGFLTLALLVFVLFRPKPAPNLAGLPYLSGSAFAVSAVLAGSLLVLFPTQHIPVPSGPHAVGVATFELSDSKRRGVFLAEKYEDRRLLVRVWYPASPEKGSRPEKYFNSSESKTTATGFGSLLGFPPLLTHIRHVRTNSHKNAPPLENVSPFPSVIFSHGYGSFLQQNTALMEHLSSHGYAVYAIQHTYDSSATAFPNGDVAPMDPRLVSDNAAESPQTFSYSRDASDRLTARLDMQRNYLQEELRFTKYSAPIWLGDQSFVLDQIQSQNVPEHALEIVKQSRLDRVGVVGMSFGGSTAGAFCLQDERCASGVNMDGLDIHFSATDSAMPVPFLMLHSDIDGFGRMIGAPENTPLHAFNEFAYSRFEEAGTNADILRLEVKSVLHLGLSDFPLFLRRPLRNPLLGSARAQTIIDIQNDVILGFLDQTFRVQKDEFPGDILNRYESNLVLIDNSPVRRWWSTLSNEQKADLRDDIERLTSMTRTQNDVQTSNIIIDER